MTNDWTIQSRSLHCATTGAEFTEGEYFYTLLFDEKAGFRREDLCEEAFKVRPETPAPFSFWRSKFEPPQAAPPEAVSKQTAEDLLRSYMMESGVEHSNARYILALMLERKRILREVEVKRSEDGSLTRIYERAKTGEVFIIPDPELRLDQVEQVQMQVAGLLGGIPQPAPVPEPRAAAAPAPSETEVASPS